MFDLGVIFCLINSVVYKINTGIKYFMLTGITFSVNAFDSKMPGETTTGIKAELKIGEYKI